jgi:osmoprotectant transport system substrate-binding protein
LSDLAAKCGGGVSLGGPAECPTRPFCQPGLESTYTLKVTKFTSLDAGGPLSKTALKQGKVAIALLFSSDAALAG